MVAVPARTMNEREWDCSPRLTGARGESLLPFRRNEDLQGFWRVQVYRDSLALPSAGHVTRILVGPPPKSWYL